MKVVSRLGTVGSGIAGLLLLGALSIGAQEPTAKGANERGGAPTTKRAYDRSRRVPNFYGQLGLTPEQRESIYKIRGKHYQEIDALQKQIDDLQAKMLTECEAVLTDTQKQMLASRRGTAAEGKKGAQATSTSKDQAKAVN